MLVLQGTLHPWQEDKGWKTPRWDRLQGTQGRGTGLEGQAARWYSSSFAAQGRSPKLQRHWEKAESPAGREEERSRSACKARCSLFVGSGVPVPVVPRALGSLGLLRDEMFQYVFSS